MTQPAILVTGGAGYIGSHVVQQLAAAGERIVVLDNLGRGFRQAVTAGTLVVGDVGDHALVSRLLKEHQVDTVMHCAAHTIVPESVAEPLKYYGNNTCGTRSLLQACLENGVKHVVFSSTAAVYGMPAEGYADETSPTQPINAYGTSKLMSEWMLRDVAAASALRYVALRYFNVAGSDPTGRIGQSTKGATLLTKVACEAMVGKRTHVSVFGSDYATPDGTGVRDYLHVVDLATAHLNALTYLRARGPSVTLNVGYTRYAKCCAWSRPSRANPWSSVRRRAAPAIRRISSRARTGFGRSSAGIRAMTTSRRSSRVRWLGSGSCWRSLGSRRGAEAVGQKASHCP